MLRPLVRACLASAALIALGTGARLWPQPEPTTIVRPLLPLPEDLCTAGREGLCLAPGFRADELVALYGLPPESADRLGVSEDGSIRFEADRIAAER